MAYGDPTYTFIMSGCTVTSAVPGHNLYGNNTSGGLSAINADEVVHIIVSASGGDFRMSLNPAAVATNDTALRVQAAASLFDLPPLSRHTASQITFAREGANNPVAFWTVLARKP